MTDISNSDAIWELQMLKRTVQANCDADKALDKAIEVLGDNSVLEDIKAIIKHLLVVLVIIL